MWPGKFGKEGLRLVKACDTLCEAMKTLGIAIDGGKDSMSMTVQVNSFPSWDNH